MLEALKIFGMVWLASIILCVLFGAGFVLEEPFRNLWERARKLAASVRAMSYN
jgi:hypothetical protein